MDTNLQNAANAEYRLGWALVHSSPPCSSACCRSASEARQEQLRRPVASQEKASRWSWAPWLKVSEPRLDVPMCDSIQAVQLLSMMRRRSLRDSLALFPAHLLLAIGEPKLLGIA